MNENTGYSLLDGLQPLKRYLSLSTSHQSPITLSNDKYNDLGQDISDWGIDSRDFRSLSSPTLVNGGDYSSSTFDGDTLEQPIENFNDWGLSPQKLLKSKTKNASLGLIYQIIFQKYHDIELNSIEFQDEFRYILITSQLLDETILVSKYYNKKKNSALELNRSKSIISTRFGKILRLNSSFSMELVDEQFSKLIPVILLIHYLFNNHQKFSHMQIKLFLIVTGLSLFKVLQSKITRTIIVQNTLLGDLKKFIKTHHKLDLLLQKFNNKYKELKLFSNLLQGSKEINQEDSEELFHLINSSITTLTNSIISNISSIIPLVNSSELENYCGIYNVEINDLAFLLQDFKPMNLDKTSSIDVVYEKLRKFHYLRRFYLCCLLAINNDCTKFERTTFLMKIQKLFQLQNNSKCCSIFEKWSNSSLNLKKSQKLGESIQLILNEYKSIESITNTIGGDFPQTSTSTSLKDSELFEKVKEFQTELLLFDKDQLIDSQVEQFTKFGALIESLNSIYKRDLLSLKKSMDKKPFNLLASASIKKDDARRKRYSLPVQPQHISPRSVSLTSPKNYKRLSTGLSVPLLTVLEDEESLTKRTVSYDDNYLNIAPNYTEEPTYNINQTDYISNRHLLSNDDSVVICSVEADGEVDNVLNDDELKRTLESKFSRITSTSTVLSDILDHQNSDNEEEIDEINYNNEKLDIKQALPLMNELRAALNKQPTI